MSEGVMSVSADATVLDAATLFVNCQVSTLPVVDRAGTMLGILSEADLVGPRTAGVPGGHVVAFAASDPQAAAESLRRKRNVAEVMTRAVVYAAEDTPLSELARLMCEHNVKRLPIVRNGCVVGIVSRTDLLRALMALESARDESGGRFDRDQQLRTEIAAACRGRSWATAQKVDIVVNRGVAHLWGVAPSDMVRKAYAVATENVPGVKKVEMHMHVVPPAGARIGL
jgi:CBS-domain-containing membrane protein